MKLKNFLATGAILVSSLIGSSQEREIIWYGENHFEKSHQEYVLNDLKKRDISKTIYLMEMPQEWEKSLKKWLADSNYTDTIIHELYNYAFDPLTRVKKPNDLGIEIKFIDATARDNWEEILNEGGMETNLRDAVMAYNINKISKENPNKDLIICTGAFHAIEEDYAYMDTLISSKYPPAARILKDKYGIDPKTIGLIGNRKRKSLIHKFIKPKKRKLFDEYVIVD